MNLNYIIESVGQYYTGKIHTYGATARGVDWNSSESQALRFDQLLRLGDMSGPFSINDYGCGYGALAGHLLSRGCPFRYCGFDICHEMVAQARSIYGEKGNCEFFTDESQLTQADYTLASGIFNVKLRIPEAEWEEYIFHTLGRIAALSGLGFAVNMLTSYSDKERMRQDLYYGDPAFWFDYCKRNFSERVALLHDYPLYEFTLLVKKT